MISQTRVTVPSGPTPTLLWTANGRTTLKLKTPNQVIIGNSSVTDTNGFTLNSQVILSLELSRNDELYAVASSPAVVEILVEE
jgi:hypothetical protein